MLRLRWMYSPGWSVHRLKSMWFFSSVYMHQLRTESQIINREFVIIIGDGSDSRLLKIISGRKTDVRPNIRPNTECMWPNIRPDTGYLAKYPAEYRISGQISGRIQDVWPNIRPNTGYLAKYPAEYRISGQISGRIQDIWPNIRPDTSCLGSTNLI